MRKSFFCFLTLLVSGFLSISCGKKEPDDSTSGDASIADDTDTEPKSFPEACAGFPECKNTTQDNSGETDYFPLVDAARWTYHHFGGREDNGSQKASSCDSVRLNETTHDNGPAFSVLDTPTRFCKVTKSIYIEDGGAVYRVFKEEFNTISNCDPTYPECDTDKEFHEDPDLGDPCLSVKYTDKGFLRFDDAWLEKQAGDSVLEDYYRTVVGAQIPEDADPIDTPYDRYHKYTLVDTDATVNVPAGIFKKCLVIRRERDRVQEGSSTNDAEADDKTFWFCPGVGKVKEVEGAPGTTDPRTEELVSYCIPGGLCCE